MLYKYVLSATVHAFSVVWAISLVVVVYALGIALITFSWQLLIISGSIFAAVCVIQIILGLIAPQF